MTEVIGQPIYQRIADALRAQIGSGELAVGDPLPSTRKLMEIHQASNNVVRNAIEVLRQEGLVQGQPGKAVYVRATPKVVEEERSTLKAVGDEVAGLREEVRRLAEHQPAEVIAKLEELRADVGRLGQDLETLYRRLGQPLPRGNNSPPSKRRKSGA